VPAFFTNSSADLDFWAPGVNIDAPVPTGNNHAVKNGTSMATPHLVGAMALLRECVDGNGVPITLNDALGDLNATGVNVTRNGVTRKRINVLDAATRNVNNNDFAFPETFVGNGPFNDFDFNVCADSEAGEPGPFSLDNSIWWTWTPATTGTATISTEDNGTNVTTFDTTLAVYTGNTLGTLSTVAADDDSGTGLRSLVTFPVNGGTTYRIKVDGFAAQNGLLNLHIQNGPPPACFGVPATMVGTVNADVITGTPGNDVIVAGAGNDVINGNGGNDRICGGLGNDTINGGTGDDFVLGDQGSDVIRGADGNDTLVGNPGGGSNDDANDTISGGAGNDFVDGWFGDDVLEGNAGDDFIRGAAGIDWATYATAPGPVRASLLTNSATGDGTDTFSGVENLAGSAFGDVLRGDALVNRLEGRGGSDTLHGQPGNDVLSGSAGNDVLRGGDGDDSLLGGIDRDSLVGEGGNDSLNGGAQFDACNGNAGIDSAVACEVLVGIP
jgi:Ca2+-binding RTX toxin-like protein